MRREESTSIAVHIPVGDVRLEGDLEVPAGANGIVLFAHGSGSSRYSPRNRYVARILREAGVGTLLFDLLTAEEEEVDRFTRHLRFDIPLLAGRLAAAARWVGTQEATKDLSIGFFGASTGGAAALVAAAEAGARVGAVVSRGGRPDLAGGYLKKVTSSVLLIVGELDDRVITLNRYAFNDLTCEKRLEIVPGASHLFQEPGTLEMAARLAAAWFGKHLAKKVPETAPKRNLAEVV